MCSLKLPPLKDDSNKSQLKAIRVSPKSNGEYFSMIYEVPAKSFIPLLHLRKFSASFAYLSINESKAARICYNCGCHKHLKKDCKAGPVCLNCAGLHLTSSCTAVDQAMLKCINCQRAKLPDNHSAVNFRCPFNVAQRKLRYDKYSINE